MKETDTMPETMEDACELAGQSQPVVRRHLGRVFSDTATVVVGDPCKLIADGAEVPLTYDQFVDHAKNNPIAVINGSLFVSTGADGWHDIYLEETPEGRRLVVDLTARV